MGVIHDREYSTNLYSAQQKLQLWKRTLKIFSYTAYSAVTITVPIPDDKGGGSEPMDLVPAVTIGQVTGMLVFHFREPVVAQSKAYH